MFRCSQRTVVSWVATSAAGFAALLGSASPALADSSVLVTTHPDLIAAQAISAKAVLACFDQIIVVPTFTDVGFFLQGYTVTRKTGGAGLRLATETTSGGGFCVIAAFKGAGDVRSYSRLEIMAGAVSSSVPGGGGASNPQTSVPLLASVVPNVSGFTLRPELIAAAAGPSPAATVTYTFTEQLTTAPAAASFGFYASGDAVFHPGTAVTGFTPGAANTVTVTFSAADMALFGQATRFVAGEGAVTDALGLGNPTGTIGTAATKLNDLADTTAASTASDPLTYHFDFAATIPPTAKICPAKFALYDASGARYHTTAGLLTGASNSSVTATFVQDTPGPAGDPAQITLATVAADALDATTACGGASLNSDGAAGESGATAAAGSTTGPDLLSFKIDRGTGIASYVFDAPVNMAAIGNFHLVDKSAALTSPPNQGATGILTPTPPPQFTISPSNTINVNFAAPTTLLNLGLVAGPPDLTAVRNATGVTVDEGAVTDTTAAAAVNPLASYGVTLPTPAPGTTGPTTPPAPPALTPAAASWSATSA